MKFVNSFDWTGSEIARSKKGRVPISVAPILERLRLDYYRWCELVGNFGKRFFHMAGVPPTINAIRSRVSL